MFTTKPLVLAMASAGLLLSGCSLNPEPFEYQSVMDSALMDAEIINLSQEPIDGALGLSEAMARAVKYNLENRLQLMQEALADSSYELLKMDMLPIVAATAGYNDRNQVDASRSFNIITQEENFSYSTSQDQEYTAGDVRFAWNILDFGISYFQAKQEGDRYILSGLGRQKVMLRILEEARGAYWRAVAMQSIEGELESLLARAKNSLEQLQIERDNQLRAPMITLQDTRALVELIQQLEEMQESVNMARIELATLINEPPGSEIPLVQPDVLPELPALPADVETLELTALANSADYVGEMYNLRIDQLESRKAMMRLLPGLEFSYGANYHSNSYLFNDNWGMLGLRLTGNLMRLVARNQIAEQNEARLLFAETRKLTVNMSVLTQIHLAWQQYSNTLTRLERAQLLNEIDQDISTISQQSRAASASTGISQIQNEARALRSKMSQNTAFADAQTSYASFLTSLTLDPIPVGYQHLSVDELAPILESAYQNWEAGNIPNLGAAMSTIEKMPEESIAELSEPSEEPNPNVVSALVEATTPAIVASAAQSISQAQALETLVGEWLDSWERQDASAYIGFYHPDFPVSGNLSRQAWLDQRRQRISSPDDISISYDGFEIVEQATSSARVRFWMDYSADDYADRTQKELYVYFDGDRWRISDERSLQIAVAGS